MQTLHGLAEIFQPTETYAHHADRYDVLVLRLGWALRGFKKGLELNQFERPATSHNRGLDVWGVPISSTHRFWEIFGFCLAAVHRHDLAVSQQSAWQVRQYRESRSVIHRFRIHEWGSDQ